MIDNNRCEACACEYSKVLLLFFLKKKTKRAMYVLQAKTSCVVLYRQATLLWWKAWTKKMLENSVITWNKVQWGTREESCV